MEWPDLGEQWASDSPHLRGDRASSRKRGENDRWTSCAKYTVELSGGKGQDLLGCYQAPLQLSRRLDFDNLMGIIGVLSSPAILSPQNAEFEGVTNANQTQCMHRTEVNPASIVSPSNSVFVDDGPVFI